MQPSIPSSVVPSSQIGEVLIEEYEGEPKPKTKSTETTNQIAQERFSERDEPLATQPFGLKGFPIVGNKAEIDRTSTEDLEGIVDQIAQERFRVRSNMGTLDVSQQQEIHEGYLRMFDLSMGSDELKNNIQARRQDRIANLEKENKELIAEKDQVLEERDRARIEKKEALEKVAKLKEKNVSLKERVEGLEEKNALLTESNLRLIEKREEKDLLVEDSKRIISILVSNKSEQENDLSESKQALVEKERLIRVFKEEITRLKKRLSVLEEEKRAKQEEEDYRSELDGLGIEYEAILGGTKIEFWDY